MLSSLRISFVVMTLHVICLQFIAWLKSNIERVCPDDSSAPVKLFFVVISCGTPLFTLWNPKKLTEKCSHNRVWNFKATLFQVTKVEKLSCYFIKILKFTLESFKSSVFLNRWTDENKFVQSLTSCCVTIWSPLPVDEGHWTLFPKLQIGNDVISIHVASFTTKECYVTHNYPITLQRFVSIMQEALLQSAKPSSTPQGSLPSDTRFLTKPFFRFWSIVTTLAQT